MPKKDALAVIIPVVLIIIIGILIVNIDYIFPAPSAYEEIESLKSGINLTSQDFGTSPNASVTVIEFSDFQCPACAMASPEVKKAREFYGDRVNFVYKHMVIKPGSETPAEASECARDQGKFWEFNDMLFENLHRVSEPDMIAFANALGLDTGSFTKCLTSGEKSIKLRADMRDAYAAGVKGTPTFVISGKVYPGAMQFEQMKEVIDGELE